MYVHEEEWWEPVGIYHIYRVLKLYDVQIEERLGVEALAAVIVNFDSDFFKEYGSLVTELDQGYVLFKPKKLALDMKHSESPPAKRSIKWIQR